MEKIEASKAGPQAPDLETPIGGVPMKTITTVLMCSALALSGGAALAKDATQVPAAKPMVAQAAPSAKPPAARHAVALTDAELENVVAGTNSLPGAGLGTAVFGTPNFPNWNAVNGANGVLLHAALVAHTCPGFGHLGVAC
jgi:hypothetical protein